MKKKRHLSGRSMTDNWAKVGIQLVNINFSSIGTMCSSLEQLMIALALFKRKTKRFCCPGGKNKFKILQMVHFGGKAKKKFTKSSDLPR